MSKIRIDVLLTEKGLAPSREKAKALIMSGNVFIDGQREDKAGTSVDENCVIEVKSNPNPYVSRGGLKLDKAMKQFHIELNQKICMDVGASTGGFTDCMLQNGASKVYAIDVGYGQLDWKLRQDPKVVVLEKTNVRYITEVQVPDLADFASIDVSFISLNKVLEPVIARMNDSAQLVCLIKPQFEAGRDKVGKKGVVRDPKVHSDVIRKVILFALSCQLAIIGLDYSPIKGPEGNIEYLVYLSKKDSESSIDITTAIDEVVNKAHTEIG